MARGASGGLTVLDTLGLDATPNVLYPANTAALASGCGESRMGESGTYPALSAPTEKA
jgi:hypothetical protein